MISHDLNAVFQSSPKDSIIRIVFQQTPIVTNPRERHKARNTSVNVTSKIQNQEVREV